MWLRKGVRLDEANAKLSEAIAEAQLLWWPRRATFAYRVPCTAYRTQRTIWKGTAIGGAWLWFICVRPVNIDGKRNKDKVNGIDYIYCWQKVCHNCRMQSISEDNCKEWFQSNNVQKCIRAIHNRETMALRRNYTDEHAGERRCIVWLRSGFGGVWDWVLLEQRIESWWSRLRVHKTHWWICKQVNTNALMYLIRTYNKLWEILKGSTTPMMCTGMFT